MRNRIYNTLITISALVLVIACKGNSSPTETGNRNNSEELPGSSTIAPEPDIAIINVNLIPMTSEKVVPDKTVLVGQKKILAIGNSDAVDLPGGIQIIDGTGKYLLPGFADMHTHLWDETEVTLWAAKGFTTILDMGFGLGGPVDVMRLRDDILEGRTFGPNMYTTLLFLGVREGGGNPKLKLMVLTRAKARENVAFGINRKFDFMKVKDSITDTVFAQIVASANAQGYNVIGHAPRVFGANEALKRGQVMLAHSEEHPYTDFGAQNPTPAQLQIAAQTLKENDAYVTTSLVVEDMISQLAGGTAEGYALLAGYDGTEFLASHTVHDKWPIAVKKYAPLNRNRMLQLFEFQKKYIKSMSDLGANLLLGTDASFGPGMVPGFASLREMRVLRGIGMTPYQILAAATRNPGEFIAKYAKKSIVTPRKFGLIKVDYRADLVLLGANPLDNIENTELVEGVMISGRWYTKDELATKLEALRN